jgi:hypothetical protein
MTKNGIRMTKVDRGPNDEPSSFRFCRSRFIICHFMAVLISSAVLLAGCKRTTDDINVQVVPDQPELDRPHPPPQPDRPEIESLSQAQLRTLAEGADRYCEALAQLGCRASITVNLSYTDVTDADVAKLAFPAATESINLSETSVGDDAIAGLTSLSRLRTLLVSSTAVTDRSISYLQQLPQLVLVDLMNTQVSSEGQTALMALLETRVASGGAAPPAPPDGWVFNTVAGETARKAAADMDRYAEAVAKFGGDVELHLDFSRLPLTDADLKQLPWPKCVRGIDLSHSKVTDQSLTYLRQAVPDLEKISLNSTAITDAGVKELMAMPRLCEAPLEGTNIAFRSRIDLTQALTPHLTEKARRRGREPAENANQP